MKIKKILASSPSLESRSPWVQAVVALADSRANIVPPKRPPEHVTVTRIDKLVDYIKSEPRRIEVREIELIKAEVKSKVELE
jgi:hypothetical protein